MPWIETEDHNKRLLEALTFLAKERGALGRLAGALDSDQRIALKDAARSGDQHKRKISLIAPSTIERWQQGGLEKLMRAQPHKKRLVYEFLERSEEFRTAIYNPSPDLPDGFAAFVAAQKETLSKLRFEGLNNLDGVYRLYRRAWTTPARNDRVLISKLIFQTVGGLTRYWEEQDYKDDVRGNISVEETDEGVAFASGSNLFLLGFGKDEARIKFSAIHALRPMIDGEKPVHELRGSVMGVTGEGPHASTLFIAYRANNVDFLSEVVPAIGVDRDIRSWIGCALNGEA
ncbi:MULTISPECIES: hypothetical protein [unclassified Roseitalea]|uniref:hypothetical protein n=1 Tax=unclassified Roseitalea TaxID=2639107 RepID=UPI00273FF368|nr:MULTISPECIES: hypothetical protein [unclassified Roseitalea]